MNVATIRNTSLIMDTEDQCSEEYAKAAKLLKAELITHNAQLDQLINKGPVDDGDIMSKSDRDALIHLGLATKVAVKGEQGFTAATYKGWDVFHANNH